MHNLCLFVVHLDDTSNVYQWKILFTKINKLYDSTLLQFLKTS
jgi:hypothetical protein